MPPSYGGQPYFLPMNQPLMAPGYPQGGYAQPQPGSYAPPPRSYPQQRPQPQQPGGYAQRSAVPAVNAVPSAPPASVPPRTVRGVAADRPVASSRLAPVSIPTPEELQIPVAASPPSGSAEVDWTETRRRLRELGVNRFQFEQRGEGGCRFSCWLTGGLSNTPVQVDGATEAEAVRLCLQRLQLLQQR
jgi:hypothetical protein